MIVVSNQGGYLLASTATLLEPTDTLRAWAERYVRADPGIRWILGNYVEADRANSNGHIFPLADLVVDQHSLAGKSLNMMHRQHYIVGAYAGAQVLTPDGLSLQAEDIETFQASDTDEHPVMEALAGLWHTIYPEEFFNIRRAHNDGTLFLSHETRPHQVSCPTCDVRADYAGLDSDTYCTHMQGATGPKRLHGSVFGGGAIIIPPVQPGWKRADVKTISKLIRESADEAEAVYAQVAEQTPHLSPRQWEETMAALMVQARQFSTSERERLAKKKQARPDGSFPIETVGDLKNAIRAVGRAKNPGAAKAHIKKRARALGREDLIPEGW